jgi:hypothetical protein
LYRLTYDIWNAVINEAVDAYSPLFEVMQRAADGIILSKSLVDKLKQERMMDIVDDNRHFLLTIELYDDLIEGFKISLMSSESYDVFENIKERVLEAHDVTFEDIRNFEAEHGLDMADEILNGSEEKYSVYAEKADEDIVLELVIFDSEDIDNNSRMTDEAWK